jgi:predicted nucleic-acid-binding protein
VIGIDTNVLVRYLTQDEPAQSAMATELIEQRLALKEARGSFADALIGALGATAGCTRTVTVDRKASRLAEFELL